MVNPWEVVELNLDAEKKRLDIKVDFRPGSTFPCPTCGDACKVHDASPQTWRHLNFFQYLTYVEARQPRTKCDKHGVLTVDVPWARGGSNFTLLFEAMVVELARNGLTVAAVGRIVGEHDTLLWRILGLPVSRLKDPGHRPGGGTERVPEEPFGWAGLCRKRSYQRYQRRHACLRWFSQGILSQGVAVVMSMEAPVSDPEVAFSVIFPAVAVD